MHITGSNLLQKLKMVLRNCYLKSLNEDLPDIILRHQTECNLDINRIKIMPDFLSPKIILNASEETSSRLNGFAIAPCHDYALKSSDVVSCGNASYEIVCVEEESSAVKNSVVTNGAAPKNKPALAAIFNKALQTKKAPDGTWEFINNSVRIFTPENMQHRSKIAAFDLDGTIIKTKSGRTFAKDGNDWQLFCLTIKSKLSEKFNDDYKLVIFTNQSALGDDIALTSTFKCKVIDILTAIGLPIQVFVHTRKDIYRKPLTGSWQLLEKEKNGDVPIDLQNSFYVGDAAGRIKGWEKGKKKDFSKADRLFALNVGLHFYTPEEFFLNQGVPKYEMPSFNPTDLLYNPNIKYSFPDTQEAIMLVGPPGAGKSQFCKNILTPKGYTHISRDIFKDWKICVNKLEDALKKKKNVVIDNTNPDATSRKKYIESVKKLKLPCRCFVFNIDKDHTRHNNKFRQLTDKTHSIVTDVIIHSYYKNFEPPTEAEGFSEIVNIKFNPQFECDKLATLYRQYILDN